MKARKTFAKNLKRIREKTGMNGTQFAHYLQICKTTYYKLEEGAKDFHSSTLDQIAARLNTTPAELLGGSLDIKHMCESLLQATLAFSELLEVDRERAFYYFTQFISCWMQKGPTRAAVPDEASPGRKHTHPRR